MGYQPVLKVLLKEHPDTAALSSSSDLILQFLSYAPKHSSKFVVGVLTKHSWWHFTISSTRLKDDTILPSFTTVLAHVPPFPGGLENPLSPFYESKPQLTVFPSRSRGTSNTLGLKISSLNLVLLFNPNLQYQCIQALMTAYTKAPNYNVPGFLLKWSVLCQRQGPVLHPFSSPSKCCEKLTLLLLSHG